MQKISLIVVILSLFFFMTACEGINEPEVVGVLPSPTANLVSLIPPNSAPDLVRGAAVFAENCTRCHGITGAGDGEFVISGQVQNVADFTNPATRAGKTPTDFYVTVTQGRIQNLMPPFSGSLTDEDRWAVANYVYQIAGESIEIAENPVALPVSTEEAATIGTATTETATNPHEALPDSNAELPEGTVLGTFSGTIRQGTADSVLPENLTVTLRMIDFDLSETSLATTINADGSYQFTNVPIVAEKVYLISVEHNEGAFNSDFAFGKPAEPHQTIDLTIYEQTSDPSVIHYEYILSQIDTAPNGTLRVLQLYSVKNTSDRLFVQEDTIGRRVALQIPIPEGATVSEDNDFERYLYDNAHGFLYDSRPPMPNVEHTFHITYTLPEGQTSLVQTLPYAFNGSYEVYTLADEWAVNLDFGTELGTQPVGSREYLGIGGMIELPANSEIGFSLRSTKSFELDPIWTGRILIGLGLGLVLIALASVFIRGRQTAPVTVPPAPNNAAVESLLEQIAVLDEQYHAKSIKKKLYESQRAVLKAQLAQAMQKFEKH